MLWQVQTLELPAHHGRSGAEDFGMVRMFSKQESDILPTLEFRRFLSVLRPVSVHLLHLHSRNQN